MKSALLRFAAIAVVALTVGGVAARAQDNMNDPYRDPALAALKGKSIAYLPISIGFDLAQAWGGVIKTQADRYGMTFKARDPNWSTDAMAQAMTSLIAEHPDVIVTQNPDLQSLARLLKQANRAGIRVIQMNMQGAVQTDAFVGPDFISMGEQEAEMMAKACGKDTKTSHKIAIVQGVLTGGVSYYQVKGLMEGLKAHPEIKVVSSQAADWDASKARAVTETVLQQNPDLCGIADMWDGQGVGTGAAIKQAGKQGQVYFLTSGGGAQSMCDRLADGTFSAVIDYDAPGMGRDAFTAISALLQSKQPAGSIKFQLYSPTRVMTKADVKAGTCWDPQAYAALLR